MLVRINPLRAPCWQCPSGRQPKLRPHAPVCMQPPNDDKKPAAEKMKQMAKTTNKMLDNLSQTLFTPQSRGGWHDWTLMIGSTLLLVWASAQAYRLALYAHYYLHATVL